MTGGKQGTPDDPVLFTGHGSIAHLVLNRPAKRNAITPEVAAALAAAVDRLESDPGYRVGVLSGAGEAAFCAGADLGCYREQAVRQRRCHRGRHRFPRAPGPPVVRQGP